MRSTMLTASTLAAALVLAAGAAAAANDRPKNRGYVVGDGGVARLADGGQPTAEAAQPDQTAPADTTSPQPPAEAGSSARAAAPIGVNEPGVNGPAIKIDGGAPQRIPADAAAARHQPRAVPRSGAGVSLPPDGL